MSVRKLVESDAPVLRRKVKSIENRMFAVENKDGGHDTPKYTVARLRDICDTLTTLGSGQSALAANQIGIDWDLYVVIREVKNDDKISLEFFEFFNPEIIEYSEEKYQEWEMCFSLPGKVYLVERSDKVTLKYQLVYGGWKVEELIGMDAVVAQHEVDHLNGILASDKALESMSTNNYYEYLASQEKEEANEENSSDRTD